MEKRLYSCQVSCLFIFLALMNVLSGCNAQNQDKEQSKKNENGHFYKNIFGERYYATGQYLKKNNDSVETGLWFISNLSTPMVLYGNYSDGLPIGDWKFGLNDGMLLSSQWSKYRNSSTKCSFSLPFKYNESIVDSNYFRLRTVNDSLGKISIIVGVSDTSIKNLDAYGLYSENGLRVQGCFRINFFSLRMVDRCSLSSTDMGHILSNDSTNSSLVIGRVI